jgi:uncharacterized SAM-binding protein YcdF (DUF218 family)
MKRLLVVGAAALSFSGALFLTHERLLLAVGDLLVRPDPLRPADLIVVTTGDPTRDEYGIRLYQQGYGARIFFTGGWCPIHGDDAKYGKARAAELGVPPEAIAYDNARVTSTYAEAEKLQAYIAANRLPVRSVIVVSDPHHTWRTQWTFRQVLGDGVRVQMAPVPFESSRYQRRWWTDAASRRLVAREYGKIVYYLARYKYSVGPLRDWLASLEDG